MLKITVYTDPWTDAGADALPCTRVALIGLELEAVHKVPPGGQPYPQGVYLVAVPEILCKLREKNDAAYEEFSRRFGTLNNRVLATGHPYPLQLPFPFDCCSEVTH